MNIDLVSRVCIEAGIFVTTHREKNIPTAYELDVLMSRISSWSCYNGILLLVVVHKKVLI